MGDRAQFVVLPRHYTNTLNMYFGTIPPIADWTSPFDNIVSSNRYERLRCGWVRLQQPWGPTTTNGTGGILNSDGTTNWSDFDLMLQIHTNGVLAAPTRVLNIIGIAHLTNSIVIPGNGTPVVDQTNSLADWINDVSLIYSSAAARYRTNFVYEILNEPGESWHFSNVTVVAAAMAASASVQAVKSECPDCITWSPAVQSIDTPNVGILTNAPAPLYYALADVISWHDGNSYYGPVDVIMTYTNIAWWNWGSTFPWDTEDKAIASVYPGKELAISEAYPVSPDPLGRSNTWWNNYFSPTNIPLASWTWYDMSTRYWKAIVVWSGNRVRKLLPWLGICNQGEDCYEGWSGNNSLRANGFGPQPTLSGNAILGWWLNGAEPVTNWISGTQETWADAWGGRTGGVPGLHFFEFQFGDGTTNTFVWADEDTQITTNFGVGLTDIFSNSWTTAIGKEPVIAWGWPKR